MGQVGGSGNRLQTLDLLRGVAVLGILLVNIIGMGRVLEAADYYGHDGGPAAGWGPWDQAAWWVSQLLVEGSMRGLFTLLFGAGFMLMLSRPAAGASRAREHLRRCFFLVVFGALHTLVLLWPGDILLIYGLAGVLLLPLGRLGNRTLVALAAVILLGLSAWSWSQARGDMALRQAAETAQARLEAGAAPDGATEAVLADWDERLSWAGLDEETWAEERAARDGGLLDNLRFARHLFVEWLAPGPTAWWVLDALALMLLGVVLLRTGVLTGALAARSYGIMALLGYGLGLATNFAETSTVLATGFEPGRVAWPLATYQLGRLAITFGHVGLLLWLWRRGIAARALRVLGSVGRMALTHYLGQSAIAALLFSGFGFGLYAELTRAPLWGVAAAIWAFQAAVSVAWLRRYTMGPAEWLLRGLVRGQWPPLRRAISTR